METDCSSKNSELLDAEVAVHPQQESIGQPENGRPVQSKSLLEDSKVRKLLYFLISVVSLLDFKVPSIVTEVILPESHAVALKTEVIKFP